MIHSNFNCRKRIKKRLLRLNHSSHHMLIVKILMLHLTKKGKHFGEKLGYQKISKLTFWKYPNL
jgi:hypothetical protein